MSFPAGMVLQAEKRGFSEPKVHDGLIEVVGFSNGYQAGAVMAGAKAAVRFLV